MPFFSLDLLPLTHFLALKHPIPAIREHFPFHRSFLLARLFRFDGCVSFCLIMLAILGDIQDGLAYFARTSSYRKTGRALPGLPWEVTPGVDLECERGQSH